MSGSQVEWPTITLADVLRARRAIAPHLRRTPVIEPPELAEALGFPAVLKCENLNPTGAFKVRGGINLVSTLSPEQRARGVLAVSTGNHAQSVAYAARIFGAKVTIFMPERANPLKVARTRALGADVIQAGHDFDAAREACEEHAARSGARYVHSADEPLLIAGVGTYALELLEDAPDLNTIFVPIGAGSGVLGTAIVARAVDPAIKVIGVQAEGAPAVYRSWKEGRRVETETIATFAEGLATRRPFDLPLTLLPRLVDEIMVVSDAELEASMRLLARAARQIVEGAGAAALAAAVKRRDALTGQRVGLVLSGGNVPFDQLLRILNESKG
jgi:threonine dehydratase